MRRLPLLPIAMIVVAILWPAPVGSAVAPPLGPAGSFAVLGASTVTNTGPTVVNGDLGVSPGTAITGFPPGTVNGTIHSADAAALAAQNAITTAYNALAGQPCDVNLTGQDLGGLTLTPGAYCFSSSAQLTGILTLNAQGNPAAVWVFQIGSTLTTASGSRVVFINGGQARGAFWQVGSSATLGTTTAFSGNILALASITLTTGATNSGAVFARTAAVTLDTNVVSVAAQTETFVTGAGAGVFPEGAVYLGLPLSSLSLGIGLGVADNWAAGQFQVTLTGTTVLGERNIVVKGQATARTPSAPGTANFSGTSTVDPGDGTPPLPGVPFMALVVTNPDGTGSITLNLGGTNLPAAAINEGYLTVQ